MFFGMEVWLGDLELDQGRCENRKISFGVISREAIVRKRQEKYARRNSEPDPIRSFRDISKSANEVYFGVDMGWFFAVLSSRSENLLIFFNAKKM